MDVRKKGDWENRIKFFLRGVAEVADESTSSAKDMVQREIILAQAASLIPIYLFVRKVILKKYILQNAPILSKGPFLKCRYR